MYRTGALQQWEGVLSTPGALRSAVFGVQRFVLPPHLSVTRSNHLGPRVSCSEVRLIRTLTEKFGYVTRGVTMLRVTCFHVAHTAKPRYQLVLKMLRVYSHEVPQR